MSADQPTAGSANGHAVRVSVVGHNASSSYTMFDAIDVTPEGAFFSGSMFLELDEEVKVQLDLDGGDPIEVLAKVTELDRSRPGMFVVFSQLNADGRKAITERLKSPSTRADKE